MKSVHFLAYIAKCVAQVLCRQVGLSDHVNNAELESLALSALVDVSNTFLSICCPDAKRAFLSAADIALCTSKIASGDRKSPKRLRVAELTCIAL